MRPLCFVPHWPDLQRSLYRGLSHSMPSVNLEHSRERLRATLCEPPPDYAPFPFDMLVQPQHKPFASGFAPSHIPSHSHDSPGKPRLQGIGLDPFVTSDREQGNCCKLPELREIHRLAPYERLGLIDY